jgi:hypothetical protein
MTCADRASRIGHDVRPERCSAVRDASTGLVSSPWCSSRLVDRRESAILRGSASTSPDATICHETSEAARSSQYRKADPRSLADADEASPPVAFDLVRLDSGRSRQAGW